MKNDYEALRKVLKLYIDKNGYRNLKRDAFLIYENIRETKNIDYRIAEASLVTFLSDIHMMLVSWEKIDENDIFECILANTCIREDIALGLAPMFKKLFSSRNLKKWNAMQGQSIEEFCGKEWVLTVCDNEYWEAGSVYLECELNASLTISVADKDKFSESIKNCFNDKVISSAEEIREQLEAIYAKRIKEDFEDYCNEDDYYPPVAEDYDDSYEKLINSFCAEYGLNIVSFECSGDTGNYEPKSNLKYLKFLG